MTAFKMVERFWQFSEVENYQHWLKTTNFTRDSVLVLSAK